MAWGGGYFDPYASSYSPYSPSSSDGNISRTPTANKSLLDAFLPPIFNENKKKKKKNDDFDEDYYDDDDYYDDYNEDDDEDYHPYRKYRHGEYGSKRHWRQHYSKKGGYAVSR